MSKNVKISIKINSPIVKKSFKLGWKEGGGVNFYQIKI